MATDGVRWRQMEDRWRQMAIDGDRWQNGHLPKFGWKMYDQTTTKPTFVLPGGEIRISQPQKQSGALLKHNWDLPEALT